MTNTRIITIAQIKAQIKRVNSGKNVDMDYANLRRLQKAFAKALLDKNKNHLEMEPTIIRHLKVKDFPQDTIIKVRKYRINCDRGKSTVWHAETFQDLQTGKMPFYIREFLGVV
jgi:hypothetical protein